MTMSKQRALRDGLYTRDDSPYIYVDLRLFDAKSGKRRRVQKATKILHRGATEADINRALLVRDELRVKAGRGTLLEELQQEKHGVTLRELADDEIRRIKRESRSGLWPKTVEARLNKTILPYFGEFKRVDDLTTDDLEDFVDHMADDAERATVNQHLAILHSALQTGYDRTPPKVTRIPKFPFYPKDTLGKREGFLAYEDYARLMGYLAEPLRPLVAVLYWTGIRRGEALALLWQENIYFERAGSRVPGVLKLGKTKNGHPRSCPMYGDIYDHLKRAYEWRQANCPSARHVFLWLEGSPIRDLRGEWEKAVKAAGLKGLLVHDLRRSAVTNLLQYGNFTEQEAMDISGHKTDSMIRRYQITRAVKTEHQWLKLDAMWRELSGAAPAAEPEPPAPPAAPEPPANVIDFADFAKRKRAAVAS